jgi:diphosphomevalonate decarboxylase
LNKKLKSATALACANIALIKYWGKRDPILNLPAVGSISLTLDALQTKTSVIYKPDLKKDQLTINNKEATEVQTKRVQKFMDIIRENYGFQEYALVSSENNFPTGAGLASSASAFAALSMAATYAAGQKTKKKDLSLLSRRGSGSAARSIYGGIVEMQTGEDPTGEKDFAVQLAPQDYWDLEVLILITSAEEKKIGSTEAMNLSADTSPYYQQWVSSAKSDLQAMREAITEKDFEKLGELSEYSALKMHALPLTSRPAVIYWNPGTLDLIEEVRLLRKQGIPAYFTMDAGPQVKVITLSEYVGSLMDHFSHVRWVERCIGSKLGPDVNFIGDDS